MSSVVARLARADQAAVYRLFDSADRLLYVGFGSDPESRWRDHAAKQDWWGDVARKTVEWHSTYAAAAVAEALAIDTENPLYNIRPGCRVSTTQPRPGETHVPLRLVRDAFGRLLDAAHYAGEITIVSRQGEPWAAIVPLGVLPVEDEDGDTRAADSA